MVDGRSVGATLDAEAEPRDTGAAGFLDGQGTIVLDKVWHHDHILEIRLRHAPEFHRRNAADEIFDEQRYQEVPAQGRLSAPIAEPLQASVRGKRNRRLDQLWVECRLVSILCRLNKAKYL